MYTSEINKYFIMCSMIQLNVIDTYCAITLKATLSKMNWFIYYWFIYQTISFCILFEYLCVYNTNIGILKILLCHEINILYIVFEELRLLLHKFAKGTPNLTGNVCYFLQRF